MRRAVIDFVIHWLETIAVIGFLLFPLMGFLAGIATGVIGGVVGLLFGTIAGVIICGGLFLLIQNNQTLKDIRALLQAEAK